MAWSEAARAAAAAVRRNHAGHKKNFTLQPFTSYRPLERRNLADSIRKMRKGTLDVSDKQANAYLRTAASSTHLRNLAKAKQRVHLAKVSARYAAGKGPTLATRRAMDQAKRNATK